MKTTQIEAKRTDIYRVPFHQLRIRDGFNIRTDYGNIDELALNIQQNGVKNALRGFKAKENGEDVFFITDGHRRYKALELLHDSGEEILSPFMLEDRSYSDEQRLVDMFICNEGKSLNPLEQSFGVKRLVDYGWDTVDIATKLSKSEHYVRRLLGLSSAPKKLITMIENEVISPTFAMDLQSNNQVESFLESYNKGDFNKNKDEIFPSTPPEKITKKLIQKPVFNYIEGDINLDPNIVVANMNIDLVEAIARGSVNFNQIAKNYMKKVEKATNNQHQKLKNPAKL